MGYFIINLCDVSCRRLNVEFTVINERLLYFRQKAELNKNLVELGDFVIEISQLYIPLH